jgi:uncharacterized protein (DUF433 family)
MNLPGYLQYESDTDFIRLTGHRIGLADVVRLYGRGSSAEMIAVHFPTLPLSLIYSVLAFYLDNKSEVDAYVAADDAELRRQEESAASQSPRFSMDELQKRFSTLRPSGSFPKITARCHPI